MFRGDLGDLGDGVFYGLPGLKRYPCTNLKEGILDSWKKGDVIWRADKLCSCQKCFAQFEANEARLCGEWAVFYHSCARVEFGFGMSGLTARELDIERFQCLQCQILWGFLLDMLAIATWPMSSSRYSFAALIYEVHAAVGSVLFRFRSQHSSQLLVFTAFLQLFQTHFDWSGVEIVRCYFFAAHCFLRKAKIVWCQGMPPCHESSCA